MLEGKGQDLSKSIKLLMDQCVSPWCRGEKGVKGGVVAVLGTQHCGEHLHRAGKATWYTRSQDSPLTFAPY